MDWLLSLEPNDASFSNNLPARELAVADAILCWGVVSMTPAGDAASFHHIALVMVTPYPKKRCIHVILHISHKAEEGAQISTEFYIPYLGIFHTKCGALLRVKARQHLTNNCNSGFMLRPRTTDRKPKCFPIRHAIKQNRFAQKKKEKGKKNTFRFVVTAFLSLLF